MIFPCPSAQCGRKTLQNSFNLLIIRNITIQSCGLRYGLHTGIEGKLCTSVTTCILNICIGMLAKQRHDFGFIFCIRKVANRCDSMLDQQWYRLLSNSPHITDGKRPQLFGNLLLAQYRDSHRLTHVACHFCQKFVRCHTDTAGQLQIFLHTLLYLPGKVQRSLIVLDDIGDIHIAFVDTGRLDQT